MFGQDMSTQGFGSAAQIDDASQPAPMQSSYIDQVTQPEPTQPWSPPKPEVDQPVISTEPTQVPTVPLEDTAAPSIADEDDLLTIKQQALSDLAPLVSQLDQSPEEKFKTTMMMIQASDDHTLVKAAYEAARAIEDEEARAHALLDVVNEINYFTSHD